MFVSLKRITFEKTSDLFCQFLVRQRCWIYVNSVRSLARTCVYVLICIAVWLLGRSLLRAFCTSKLWSLSFIFSLFLTDSTYYHRWYHRWVFRFLAQQIQANITSQQFSSWTKLKQIKLSWTDWMGKISAHAIYLLVWFYKKFSQIRYIVSFWLILIDCRTLWLRKLTKMVWECAICLADMFSMGRIKFLNCGHTFTSLCLK